MTIRIGTIHELKGEGLEIMVDVPTRSIVLAQFFDGNMIKETSCEIELDEKTIVPSLNLD